MNIKCTCLIKSLHKYPITFSAKTRRRRDNFSERCPTCSTALRGRGLLSRPRNQLGLPSVGATRVTRRLGTKCGTSPPRLPGATLMHRRGAKHPSLGGTDVYLCGTGSCGASRVRCTLAHHWDTHQIWMRSRPPWSHHSWQDVCPAPPLPLLRAVSLYRRSVMLTDVSVTWD